MNYIKKHPSITHVILSSNLDNYVNFNDGEFYTYNGVVKANQQLLLNYIEKTISELNKLDIVPIIFSPPPKLGFDVGECLERKYSSALLMRKNCEIDYAQYLEYQSGVNTALRELDNTSNVVWLKDYLCKDRTCYVAIDDVFIYRDKGHLSVDGSKKLLSKFDVNQVE